jgi:hypothetical protein
MRPQSSARRELEGLLAKPATHFKSWFIKEPSLEFGGGHQAADPKLGISTYGPCGTEEGHPLSQIRVAVIGTGDTIQEAQRWLDRCRRAVTPGSRADVDPYLFPSFPGMSSALGFNCALECPDGLVEKFSPAEIARCTSAPSRDHAVDIMGKLVGERLDTLRDREGPPDVVLVALPDDVKTKAGAGRRPPRRRKRPNPLLAQLSFFDEKREEPDPTSRTLHRVIKAEGMRYGFPTQLVWPRTFSGGDDVQDDATRAWNFCTALYYKAKGMPWRVSGLARGTCYVGISFYRPLGEPGQLQTSMAQAFSERGEGFVLRGSNFKWDRKLGPAQLPRGDAKSLLEKVIEQYKKHHGQPPHRVVIHKSSAFSEDELAGFEDALGQAVPFFDFLSVSKSNIRFLRVGKEPPLRGTVIEIAPKRYIVFSRGYVPFLRVYPGLRIPRPLEVIHARGSAPVTEVLKEFFALTRMNWNSADFASAEPITLGFSRKIGLILSELPADVAPERSFRFYM